MTTRHIPSRLAVAGWAKWGEGRADDAPRLCDAAFARLEPTWTALGVVESRPLGTGFQSFDV
jgi:hypothetical protein